MAVSSNQLIKRQDECRANYPVEESTHIYQGTLVFLNAAGYADDDAAAGVNKFGGVAIEEADNSSGADGDVNVECFTEGVFELTGSGFSQASVGQKAFATDNFTVAIGDGAVNGVYVGQVAEYVSSTKVRVRIDPVDDRAGAGDVAAAGSTQGDAAQLAYGVNNVTAADGTKGVLLPPASPGKVVHVYNSVATNGLKIYPATGETINGGSANAAITSEGKTLATLVGTSSSNWAATFTANS